jgi:hypothetical protein
MHAFSAFGSGRAMRRVLFESGRASLHALEGQCGPTEQPQASLWCR